MYFNGLVSWLSFDDSPTKDFCGKTVTAYGNPVIVDTDAINGKALQLDGSSYLKISDITLGGKDFYIDFWVNVDSSSPANARILQIINPTYNYTLALLRKSSNDATKLEFWANSYADVSQNYGYTKVSTINSIGSRVHVKLLYRYDNKRLFLYINDKFVVSYDNCPQYNRQTFDIYIGATSSGNQGLIGTIDELRIYDGTFLTSGYDNPPTAADYDTTCTLNLDTERVLANASLKPIHHYLSFAGTSSSYGLLPLSVLPGATTFTIEVKFSTTSTANYTNNYDWKTIIGREIQDYWKNDFGLCVNGGKLAFWAEPSTRNSSISQARGITSTATVNDGEIHKAAVVSSGGTIYLYCDDKLVATTSGVNAKITDSYRIAIAGNVNNSNGWLKMDLYEARFWSVARSQAQIFADIDGTESGLEAWYIPTDSTSIIPDLSGNNRDATLYGSPPYTAVYELDIALDLDTERKITNAALTWRYENPGDADDLIVASTVLTDLPATQSATGTAFYQTQRVKCFDLAATPEVWMKFDVYFDGTKWRAYNGGSNGVTGICSQVSNTDLVFFSNSASAYTGDDILKTNQLQTVLLHMISGSTAGVIEAWVDGSKIYTYIGDVNHGSDFADIYLQSDGAGTFFSNVIISNAEIGLDEVAALDYTFNLDTERKLANVFEFYLDTQRKIIDNTAAYYSVCYGGSKYKSPLSVNRKGESFAVRWNGAPLYNELVDPSDARAGIVHLWHNSREWALSDQINVGAVVPATRQSSDTYQNYHYDFVKRNFTGRFEDWTCEMSGGSASIYLPDEFNDRPKVNLTGDGETLTYGYGYDIVIGDVGEVLELDVYETNFSQRELAIDWTTKITQNYITSPICPQITGMSSTDAFVIDGNGGAVMSIVDGYDLNAVPMGGLLDYDLSVTSVEDVELVEGTDWIIGSESVVSLSPTAVANNPDGVKVSYKTYSVVDYDGSLGNSQGLAKPALEPAVRQSSVYYQNYQRDFAGPFELDTEVGDDVWTWYVASASSYIQLPDEFENLPVINIIANDELANYNDIEADEGVPYANYYKAYGGSTPDRRYVAQISFSDEGGDNFVYTAAIQFSVRITQTNITAPFYNKYDVDSWIDAFIINDDGGAYMFVDSYVDLNASAIGGLLYHDAYVTAVDDTPLERDTDWIIGGEGEVSLSPAAVIKNPQGVKISYKTYSVVDYDDSYGEPQSITTFLPWTVPDGY